jgi:hypothetical protein
MMVLSIIDPEELLMTTKPPPTMSDVRAWARERGLSVNSTGNVPNDVVEAFNKGKPAHRRFERAVRRSAAETR